MIIWILAVVLLVGFVIYNWAELGAPKAGPYGWAFWLFPALALAVWQLALQALRLHPLLALLLLLAVLLLGFYLLRRIQPPRPRPTTLKKQPAKRLRARKHR